MASEPSARVVDLGHLALSDRFELNPFPWLWPWLLNVCKNRNVLSRSTTQAHSGHFFQPPPNVGGCVSINIAWVPQSLEFHAFFPFSSRVSLFSALLSLHKRAEPERPIQS